MTSSSSHFDTGTIIRRGLFCLVLICLAAGNIFALFRGLNAPQAMDQAQIAREIARGNGFATKFIRPVAYYQAEKAAGEKVPLTGFQDTYQSPLNPLLYAAVFKLIGAGDSDAWQMKESENVWMLDRVIAMICTMCFLLAIAVNYLLISRIFDAKIAGVTAILMLFCQVFWDYALSGLPQMLMLLLFSCGTYFAYRAVEASSEGRLAMVPAIVAGVFFTLLSLAHWMTVWIALGYIVFAAIAFRPRGIVAISVLALLLIAAIGPMLRNQAISGTPFGTAYLTLYNGLGNGSEDAVMRTHDLEAAPLEMQGLVGKIARTTLLQATDIIPFLGGIVIAPLFFLSLLHPFKRPAIANFRWAILLMWITAAIGLAFFGISTNRLDPNQIHLVFAPIMTAYGLAFVSVLWSRLDIVAATPALRNVHHIFIVLLSASPLILAMPQQIQRGIMQRDGIPPQWPPYHPQPMNIGLKAWTSDQQVIMSDQPWAVAWYADRISIWLPPTREGFLRLEEAAADFQTPVAGILISPSSHGSGPVSDVALRFRDFSSLVLDGNVSISVYPTMLSTANASPRIQDIMKRYPHRISMVGFQTVYYSDRPVVRN